MMDRLNLDCRVLRMKIPVPAEHKWMLLFSMDMDMQAQLHTDLKQRSNLSLKHTAFEALSRDATHLAQWAPLFEFSWLSSNIEEGLNRDLAQWAPPFEFSWLSNDIEEGLNRDLKDSFNHVRSLKISGNLASFLLTTNYDLWAVLRNSLNQSGVAPYVLDAIRESFSVALNRDTVHHRDVEIVL